MPIALPQWLKDLPEAEIPAARSKFLLKACALYATEEGHLRGLSEALGYNPRTLFGISAGNEPMNHKVAIAIETLLGRDVITREILLPELFDYL